MPASAPATAEIAAATLRALGEKLRAQRKRLGVSATTPAQAAGVPTRIRLADYPQLERLAWQFQGASDVTPAEALSLYERNWRHIEQDELPPHERALIQGLVSSLGGSRLLV